MEEPKYSEPVGSFTAGRATFEAIASAHIDTKPPEKPPWQRLKDWGGKILAISRKVQQLVKLIEWVWEYVQPFFGRKRPTCGSRATLTDNMLSAIPFSCVFTGLGQWARAKGAEPCLTSRRRPMRIAILVEATAVPLYGLNIQ